jgi:hypothetical protein
MIAADDAFVRLLQPKNARNPLGLKVLSEETERKLREIIAHFSKEGYALPSTSAVAGDGAVSEEKAALSEKEMMFLVSSRFSPPGFAVRQRLINLQSREGILRFLTGRSGFRHLSNCLFADSELITDDSREGGSQGRHSSSGEDAHLASDREHRRPGSHGRFVRA